MKTIRLLFALATLTPSHAWTDEASRLMPANLRADRIDVNQKSGISRYRGQVVVSQGTLRVTADEAVVEQQGQLLNRVTAEGRPATFRDRLEGRNEYVEGRAQKVIYEALERKLHLAGNAELQRGDDLLKAGEVHYHLNNESVIARSQNGQRVIAILKPAQKTESDGEKQ